MQFINVRKNEKSIVVPKKILLLAKILQFFSTSAVVKFSTRLFLTPIRFSIPKREKMFYKSAQKKVIFVPSIRKNIEVLTYGYSPKKVLFIHGWSGRGTQLYLTADKLLENGFMFVSFTGPAHGKSDGKTTNMPEFVETIKEVDRQMGPFSIAIGHSFGGLCLMNAVAQGLATQKMITIGATDTISNALQNFTTSLCLKNNIALKMKSEFDKKWQRNIDENASSAQAKHVKIPTLVIHDSADGDVDVSCAIHIRQNLQKGELYISSGLGHTKILRDTKIANKILSFILHK